MPEKMMRLKVSRHWYTSDPQSTNRVEMKYRDRILRVRVHTEWRLPISDIHPIIMEKSALAGEDGGCTPTPFQTITITYKVAVYALAERTDTLTLFPLSPFILFECICHSTGACTTTLYRRVNRVNGGGRAHISCT
jgi:hypothetical protein